MPNFLFYQLKSHQFHFISKISNTYHYDFILNTDLYKNDEVNYHHQGIRILSQYRIKSYGILLVLKVFRWPDEGRQCHVEAFCGIMGAFGSSFIALSCMLMSICLFRIILCLIIKLVNHDSFYAFINVTNQKITF